MDEEDDPLLHNNVVPAIALVDNTELPQLLVTVITGVGVDLGADDALAVAVQPLAASVRVTLYVAASVTVMDDDDEPLLHNNVVPATVPADNTELPQLLVTVITGVGVITGSDCTLAGGLVHPPTFWVTV